MTRRSAPGKLFIAGEYAVIEPGHPAILVAVDRGVSVHVSTPSDVDDTLHVAAAKAIVGDLRAERGLPPLEVHVTVESTLHDNGTKFGLGSSGAVTVATVNAVAAYGGLELSQAQLYRLAMLATARIDPRASGGDLAASVWGGWIAYQAPDRTAVLDLAQRRGISEALRAPWPGFAVRHLPAPRGLALEVGWTGEPASTATLAGRLTTTPRTFLSRSDECVRAAIRALDQGDDHELMRQIRTARQMLADLDDEAGLGVFTPRLTALCDAAEAVGGAAKPSGAGGGDCGIAVLDATATAEISQLRKEWDAAGVRPLPIRVEPRNGSAE